MRWRRAAAPFLLLLAALLAGCSGPNYRPTPPGGYDAVPDAVPRDEPRSRYGNPASYVVKGRRYYTLRTAHGYRERGIASWYGHPFHGRRTSSGETYDMYRMTAAHKSLPLPSYVEVTNLETGARIVVRVNDRGPFHDNRLIDLSYSAARKLGIWQKGTGLVEVRAITAGEPRPASPPVVATAGRPGIYLQVGAFGVRANAERLSARVSRLAGVKLAITGAESAGQRVWRVRLGPLSGVDKADRLTGLLLARGFEVPHVVIE